MKTTTIKCECGGIMHHSSTMENPGPGEFYQCEDCGQMKTTSEAEPATPRAMHLLRQSEAARHYGVSRQRIGQLIDGGRLGTTDIGGVRFVAASEVAGLVRLPPGRPKSKKPQ